MLYKHWYEDHTLEELHNWGINKNLLLEGYQPSKEKGRRRTIRKGIRGIKLETKTEEGLDSSLDERDDENGQVLNNSLQGFLNQIPRKRRDNDIILNDF